MKTNLQTIFLTGAFVAGLTFTGSAIALQAPAAAPKPAAAVTAAPAPKAAATPKPAAMVPPTDAEIAAARAKGLVWVNTSSKVFHADGSFYGKTKAGKFMTADEATKAGFRAAKAPTPPTAKAAKK